MKRIFKYAALLTLTVGAFTACIEEEFPTDVVNEQQVQGSPSGLEAAVNANNAWLTESMSVLDSQGDFGYPGICMGLDALTSDVAVGPDYGYDAEFLRWRAITALSADYNAPYFVWKFFYTLNMYSNAVIKLIDLETADDQQKVAVAQAYVYRAMAYLYLTQVFEYRGPEKGGFEGLSVPIVSDKTTEAEAGDNPRETAEKVHTFIETDLLTAIEMLDGYKRPKKNKVDQAVAYGMLARLYMWQERWEDAEKAARNAIDKSGATIMTEAQWHDKSTGFNSIDNPSWMWGIIITSDDRVVTTGICNFVSFMSIESTYGYTSAGGYGSTKQIDKNLYESIPDTDWRKKSWLDPDLEKFDYQFNLDIKHYENIASYSALKFRPGGGNTGDFMTGSAADFPLMRVEEMYLIEAEAAAMQDAARGKALLEAFALTRNPEFVSIADTSEKVQAEILFQKRIELWGEGLIMFDLKRQNVPQIRGYAGTNHFAGSRYNSPDGTACWTTLQIPTLELQSNKGITSDTQNPDPYELRGKEWVE